MNQRRPALTLLEVVVVIAIVAIILLITLPAVQMAREATRRTQCSSNLRQMGLAIHGYHADHGYIPAGNVRSYSLHVALLPYLEYGQLFNSVNYSFLFRNPENATVASAHLTLYVCPSDSVVTIPEPNPPGRTNYTGNAGTGALDGKFNGLFWYMLPNAYGGGQVRLADVTDGLSNTAALSEHLVSDGSNDFRRIVWNTPRLLDPEEFKRACRQAVVQASTDRFPWERGIPWVQGHLGQTMYNHMIEPNGPSCLNFGDNQAGIYSTASWHRGGVNVLLGDARVAFFGENIPPAVWRALGSRSGGEPELSGN